MSEDRTHYCVECVRLAIERDEACSELAKLVVRADNAASLIVKNGCDCECDHDSESHGESCERCLACQISEALWPSVSK